MLRVIRFNNRSTSEVQVQFSQNLASTLGILNVSITASAPNQPGLQVQSVRVVKSVLSITILPQSPLSLYQLNFLSAGEQKFSNEDGEEIQDSERIFYFMGQESDNPIRDQILDQLPSTYDLSQDNEVRNLVASTADLALRARTDIRETGNAVLISEEILDEIHVRGYHPTDRLGKEGAFEITRVGLTPTGTDQLKSYQFLDSSAVNLLGPYAASANLNMIGFPTDPFSLRSVEVVREQVSNSSDSLNSFDGLTVSLAHKNISHINAIKLVRLDGSSFVYDIRTYGYSLVNNRYDTRSARTLLTLQSNQFKLSELAVFDNAFQVPGGNDVLEVSYVYRNDGINVNTDAALTVSIVRSRTREGIGPLLPVFSLKRSPIVLSNDTVPTLGGVSFLDPAPPSGQPFSQPHPAFRNELAFDLSRLPANPGEYTVNYQNGQVIVFGSGAADGTGDSPPVANYLYRQYFYEGIDYNIDLDDDEIVAVPGRELIGEHVKLQFRAETVLVDGVDWKHEAHLETSNEYVENRFPNQLQIATRNVPITNVFEIFNETTGERYAIERFSSNYINFLTTNPPRFVDRNNEPATLSVASNEELLVSEDLDVDVSTKILKLSLRHPQIVSVSGQKGASNTNTSLRFSKSNIFLKEFFFDDILETLGQNLAKLSVAGDYLVDYRNAEIYLLTNIGQSEDVGSATYQYGQIETSFGQVIGANEIGYRQTIKSNPTVRLTSPAHDSDTIELSALPEAVERFYLGDSSRPILLGTVQQGLVGQTYPGSYEFTASDGNFTSNLSSGSYILRVSGDSDRAITGVSSSKTLLVDQPFTDVQRGVAWTIIDFDLMDGYQVIVSYDPTFVRGVYTVAGLQSQSADQLVNYWDAGTDTVDGNRLIFRNQNIQSLPPGTALAVDYSFGTLFLNYTYVKDVIRVTYEYGDNSINFGISDAVQPGTQYYASYRYGALREKLLQNFGILTSMDELTNFPVDFDRENYRNFISGAVQGFVNGPTVPSIKNAVHLSTGIDPTIRELTFDEWTAGRDNIYLQPGHFVGTPQYRDGRFGNGLVIGAGQQFSFPAESYISYRDGTFESWVSPDWAGLDNDASLTFQLSFPASRVFIGAAGFNPASMPFTLNRRQAEPLSPVGRPVGYDTEPGAYVWFDDLTRRWNFHATTDGYGRIQSSGDIYQPVGPVRSGLRYIEFDGYRDGQDGYTDGQDGYSERIAFTFGSDNHHYLIDAGASLTDNRISIFKDGSGYLNFRVFDDSGRRHSGRARSYAISKNIQDWKEKERHHIAAAWRFNTAEGIDELHLFVDGQETSNLLKFGGRPESQVGSVYRTVAEEVIDGYASVPTVGRADGISQASSNILRTPAGGLLALGIQVGDQLTILDATIDGANSPYTISAVGDQSVQLSASLILSLNNITFSINQQSYQVATNIDVENFIVLADDGYQARELHGLQAVEPDYQVSRTGGINHLTINGEIKIGDQLTIQTLGLTKGRCRDDIYLYQDGYSDLYSRGAPPASLQHIEAFKYIVRRTKIGTDGYAFGDGYIQIDGYQADGYFSGLPQPSNSTNGKRLALTLGGTSNIDFSGLNQITIHGTSYEGGGEMLVFTDYGTQTTSKHFTRIDWLEFNFTSIDPSSSLGSFQIIEAAPFTEMENNGNYAQLSGYNNGRFSFVIFGTGDQPFPLEGDVHYLLDYPVSLDIPMTRKGRLWIGSQLGGGQEWDGSIDQTIFLNEMLDDVRAGEVKTVRTVTRDYNSSIPLVSTPQTLMLLDFENGLENSSGLYTSFDERFVSSAMSVNESFGDCAVFLNKPGFRLDNSNQVLNNNAGTVEFWLNPLLDSANDRVSDRFYVDSTSIRAERIESDTSLLLTLPSRARRLVSIRLLSDRGDGHNYATDAKLLVDGRKIILRDRLPGRLTTVEVQYVPIDFSGDRFSIFKDREGSINFSIIADEQLYMISYPIDWKRNTWHRIRATWRTNSTNNLDVMRLFVDGLESGTILWGTPGLIYGSGIVYGQAAVGEAGSRSLIADINLSDTFGEVYLGNSFDNRGSAVAKLDNVRFSNQVRDPVRVGSSDLDINFNTNLNGALPVVEDNFTTLLIDFDRSDNQSGFLSNLLSRYTPLFQFDVEIDDSFRKINQKRYRDTMTAIVEKMKPAHTKLLVKYLQDLN